MIAFFFSPPAAGVEGQARLDLPWDLYLMGPDDQEPIKVLEEIYHPASFSWSPDGRRLAFSGVVGEEPGTWFFSPSTQDLRRLGTEQLSWFDWSPVGRRLAAIRDVGGTVLRPEREVVLYDLEL